MSTLQQVFDRLTMLPMFESVRPATDEEIRHIEAELDVGLPLAFNQFLKRFGYAAWFGHEILGIRPVDPSTGVPSTITPDCISETKKAIQPNNPIGTSCLPWHHVVISTDGGGGRFVLFTVGSLWEGQVHWYNFEDSPNALMTWNSFQDFLEYEIKNAVAP